MFQLVFKLQIRILPISGGGAQIARGFRATGQHVVAHPVPIGHLLHILLSAEVARVDGLEVRNLVGVGRFGRVRLARGLGLLGYGNERFGLDQGLFCLTGFGFFGFGACLAWLDNAGASLALNNLSHH